MNRKKIFQIISLLIVFSLSISFNSYCQGTRSAQQELFMYNDYCQSRTFCATCQGRVVWDEDYEITSNYNSSCVTVPSGGGVDHGWDFVTSIQTVGDNKKTLAYSNYKIYVQQNPNHYIIIDYRDSFYTSEYGNADIKLGYTGSGWWYMNCPSQDTLWWTNQSSKTIWGIKGQGTHEQDPFHVAVVIQTDFAGFKVKINDTEYDSPYQLSESNGWSLGSQHTINVESPQQANDLIFTFNNWSDNGAQSHSVTVEGDVSPLTRTAYASKPVTPDNFSGTTYNNHPNLSWDALTGSDILGYKVYRDYNKGGWQFVTNVIPKSEDDWVDNNYTTSGSPLYLTKYRITSYISSAESDYTSIYTTYTRLALKGKSTSRRAHCFLERKRSLEPGCGIRNVFLSGQI